MLRCSMLTFVVVALVHTDIMRGKDWSQWDIFAHGYL